MSPLLLLLCIQFCMAFQTAGRCSRPAPMVQCSSNPPGTNLVAVVGQRLSSLPRRSVSLPVLWSSLAALLVYSLLPIRQSSKLIVSCVQVPNNDPRRC